MSIPSYDVVICLFAQLKPFPGYEIYCDCEAEIEFRWHKADPSVGIFSGWAAYVVNKIWIISETAQKENWELFSDHPLFYPIVRAIENGDNDAYIEETIVDVFGSNIGEDD